jgi:mono/diheme cytochrome c family protein
MWFERFVIIVTSLHRDFLPLALQWWTNAVDYPFSISGKPLFGLPAAIPVTFETTILFAALTAFGAALVMNGLPRLHHPLFESDLFKRATDDRFFLVIEAKDRNFDEEKTAALLRETSPGELETFKADPRPSPIPRPFFFAGMIAFSLAILPLAAAFKMRNSTSDRPRIHPVSDMDWQPKLKAQARTTLFADGRAMRLPEPGTVAWGKLEEDELFLTGRDAEGNYLEAIPARVSRDEATLEQGRKSFEIFCAVCHGHDGQGKGAVQQLADQQGAWEGWAPPSNLVNLHQREGGKIREAGHYFETISMGRNSMRGYAAQISPEDRWAIVYYLRALQLTQRASMDDLTPEMKEALR